MNQCGDKIKELLRCLSDEIENNNNPKYEGFHARYLDIEIDAENHSRTDFMFAKLDLTSVYDFSGFRRIKMATHAYIRKLFYSPIFNDHHRIDYHPRCNKSIRSIKQGPASFAAIWLDNNIRFGTLG